MVPFQKTHVAIHCFYRTGITVNGVSGNSFFTYIQLDNEVFLVDFIFKLLKGIIV